MLRNYIKRVEGPGRRRVVAKNAQVGRTGSFGGLYAAEEGVRVEFGRQGTERGELFDGQKDRQQGRWMSETLMLRCRRETGIR